jgi:tellurite resistance protein
MERKDFYIHLGRVLYAVAKASGTVHDKEVKKMYEVVITDLSTEELFDDEGDNEAFYTEYEFESLRDSNAEIECTFCSFMKFLDENQDFLTKKMRERCITAATKIAEAYEGIDKNEQKLIDELQQKVDSLN